MQYTDLTDEVIQANRTEWEQVLGSGKYRQERGRLRTPDGGGHCCLGVATDMAHSDGVICGHWDATVYTWEGVNYGGTYIPSLVQQALGLTEAHIDMAALLNDSSDFRYRDFTAVRAWIRMGCPLQSFGTGRVDWLVRTFSEYVTHQGEE